MKIKWPGWIRGTLCCLVISMIVFVIGTLVFTQLGREHSEASHIGDFPGNADWIRPAEHPDGWDCWLLGDSDLDLNAPYLLWCDTTPGNSRRN